MLEDIKFLILCIKYHYLDKLHIGGAFMAFKNMFKKSSNKLNRDGFYIVLFLCLCIVAVTAVYVSRRNADMAKKSALNDTKKVQQEQKGNVQSVTTKDSSNISSAIQTEKQKIKVAENKTTKQTVAATKRTTKKSKSSSIKLEMPVPGETTKKYDNEELQESKTMQQWETHEGIDIACDMGTEVKAAQAGKVVDVYKDETVLQDLKTGFGVTIVIDHGDGIRTVYCNLADEVKVKKGDTVKQGEVIGTVGDTAVREASSIEGSHLHFAVLKKSGKDYITVNPKDYLK